MLSSARGEVLRGFPGDFRHGSLRSGVFSPREARVKWEKHRGIVVLRVFRGVVRRILNRKRCLNPAGQNRARYAQFGQGGGAARVSWGFSAWEFAEWCVLAAGSSREAGETPRDRRTARFSRSALLVGGTDISSRHWSPTSPFQCLTLGCSGQRPQRCQAWAYGCVPAGVFTAFVLVNDLLELGEFPTEPLTSEAHPYSPQARARRRFRYRLLVQGRAVAVLGQCLQ
ncbi:hypothetical protein Taro_009968 [Colocasia esculenta]|uniref:Uncharacterized protein n=1 Tax=Colocasia esculenta TaxID=4460 RepID=A0A843TXP1_COLES|nr:hypothetical protein [Colocasia esculenta]